MTLYVTQAAAVAQANEALLMLAKRAIAEETVETAAPVTNASITQPLRSVAVAVIPLLHPRRCLHLHSVGMLEGYGY